MKRIPVVASVALTLLLTGCVVPPPETPTPEVPDSGSGSTRTPAFAVACEDVVPLADLQSIYGDELMPAAYREAGARGSWEMQATALLQDGALACSWAPPGDRTDVLILALDAATDGFDRSVSSFLSGEVFDYRPVEVGDSAQAVCRDDDFDEGIRCHWNVLAGDVWLSFFFRHVDPAEVSDDLVARTDGALGEVVVAAIDAVAGSERNVIERVEPTLPGCNESLQQAEVADVIGVPVDELSGFAGRPLEHALGSSNPTFGQVMWAYSYERLGYRECYFGVEQLNGSAIVAPGASWILTEPHAIQSGIVSVDDLGSGTQQCVQDDGVWLCSVAVAVGEDLALVQMVSPDQARAELAALELARLLVRT